MCIACNPFCGHCRPPKKRAVVCPQCGFDNRFDIVIQSPPVERSCASCSFNLTDLATPSVAYCLNTERLCANPCHYHTIEPNPNIKRVCFQNTPPPTPSEENGLSLASQRIAR